MADATTHFPADVLDDLKNRFGQDMERTVPWFFANMPAYYFKTHTVDEQVRHLHAIVSGQVTTEKHGVRIADETQRRITYLSPGGETADLLKTLEQHKTDDIDVSSVYLTRDKALRLHDILFAPQPRAQKGSELFSAAMETMRRENRIPKGQEALFEDFLATASHDYVQRFDPERAARHFALMRTVFKRPSAETVLVGLEDATEEESRVMLAMTSPPHTGLVRQVAKVFMRAEIGITRLYTDHFRPAKGEEFSIMSFYVQKDCKPIAADDPTWKFVRGELKLVKWFESHGLEAFADEDGWPIRKVMLIMAACEFAHQFLIKSDLWAFTSENILRMVLRHRDLAELCLDFFDARFNPKRGAPNGPDEPGALARLTEAIDQLENEVARQLFGCMRAFIRHTRRTNYYLDNVYGLGFRLDPAFLRDPHSGLPQYGGSEEQPFAFFFFHGPLMQGFHVRYRDMSRGGMRVVATRSQEHFELESNRVFDEVTGLALAQQYKNKDIPEGGSKAVLLLGPGGDVTLAVKSAVNSLLDLILPGKDAPTLPGVVDYLDREEIIYLGPDERIEPEHIEWIVERAKHRGYRWPNAFMSSKPGAGINHKEYGVTSLGVIVFAEEVLKSLDIDPYTQPFTVKMTGGPRGDVAGNAVRILIEKYGANARILCMTDSRGAIYDPDGLDHAELMRLIDAELGTTDFDKARLSGDGALVADAATPEGAKLRNTIHSTLSADIFIPSGGRPDTINERNWELFLDKEGKPTAKAIVEGANIFISPPARTELQKKGVLILHGSSANKTGVICSSYEILGGLVMDEKEFIAIKEQYVAEVLDILGRRAADEAKRLLSEYKAAGGNVPLTELTMLLSKEINKAFDALYAHLSSENHDIASDGDLMELIKSYCPPVLVERYGDRILERVPVRHLYALVSAYVASRIVYAEGLGWLRSLASVRDLEEVMHAYLAQEKRLAAYAARLRASGMDDAGEMARVLESAGRKLLTREALGLE